MNIAGNLSLNSNGGTAVAPTNSSVSLLATDYLGIFPSIITIGGTTTVGKPGDNQLSSLGGATGSLPTYIFKSDVTFNSMSSSSSPGTYIFDKPGNQALINNSLPYAVVFQNALIGQANNTALTVSGTPLGNALYTGTSGGDLVVKAGASLILPQGSAFSQLGNSATAQGTFSLGALATLKLGDSTSAISLAIGPFPGYLNNNFPAHFATTTLNASSTVDYNSGNLVNPTVYAPVTYGNLVISNSSGSGLSTKNLTANITGIASNLTVNSFASFDQQTFRANRVSAGGTLVLNSNSTLKLSGASGGQTGSNFPLNFTTMTLDQASTTEYAGGAQSIFGGVPYGNLVLSGTLAKTAPATPLTIKGNLSKPSATSFVHNSGLVAFTGTALQSVTSTLPAFKFNNVTNNNTVGLNINNDCSVVKELLLGASSKLNLASEVSLLSSAASTANVAAIPATASISYTGTGKFIVERFIPTGINHGKSWQLLSVPVRGAQSIKSAWQENNAPGSPGTASYGTTISSEKPGATLRGYDFYTVPGPSMKTYNPATNTFISVDDGVTSTGSVPISNKQGYMLLVRGDRFITNSSTPANTTTLRTAGPIYTPAVSETPAATLVGAGQFATVGNPYASAIDFTLLSRAPGVDNKFYVWDPLLPGSSSYGLGGYQTVSSAVGFLPTPGSTNYPPTIPVKSIQSGQAFYVYATGGGSIGFTEAAKISSSALVFRPVDNNLPPMLSVSLYTTENMLRGPVDGNIIAFQSNFSNENDADDAKKIPNTEENIGINVRGTILAVEARHIPVDGDTIFYHLSHLRQQAYQLRFKPMDLPLQNLQAFIVDRFLHTTSPLSLSDSAAIDFTVTADISSQSADRFYLIFKKLEIVPVRFISISGIRDREKHPVLTWEVAHSEDVTMYDVEKSNVGSGFISTGLLLKPSSSGSGIYTKTDLLSPPVTQNYRVKATTANGQIYYSSIVHVAGEQNETSVTVYPNPIVNRHISISFVNKPNGLYVAVLKNKLGQELLSEAIQVNSAYQVATLQVPKQIARGTYQLVISSADAGSKVEQVIID